MCRCDVWVKTKIGSRGHSSALADQPAEAVGRDPTTPTLEASCPALGSLTSSEYPNSGYFTIHANEGRRLLLDTNDRGASSRETPCESEIDGVEAGEKPVLFRSHQGAWLHGALSHPRPGG